jgi:hypothetical protein
LLCYCVWQAFYENSEMQVSFQNLATPRIISINYESSQSCPVDGLVGKRYE